MSHLRTVVAVTLLTLLAGMPGAEARKKPQNAAQAGSARVECFKQYGASYDAANKKWMMYVTERDAMSRLDAVRDCVAKKSGGRDKALAIPEKWSNP